MLAKKQEARIYDQPSHDIIRAVIANLCFDYHKITLNFIQFSLQLVEFVFAFRSKLVQEIGSRYQELIEERLHSLAIQRHRGS